MYDPISPICQQCGFYDHNLPANILRKNAIDNPKSVDVQTLSDLNISIDKPGCTNANGNGGLCPLETRPVILR